MPLDLIETATRLAAVDPSEADLRRAVSTAYYALFHAVASSAAVALVPDRTSALGEEAATLAYRAIDHGMIRTACLNRQFRMRLPVSIGAFADRFVELQAKRYQADYAPDASFLEDEVRRDIDACEAAILGFLAAPEPERRAFLAFVLFRGR